MTYTSKFIQAYDHDGRIGVLVEFALKGDSITIRMPEFLEFAKDIAVHIAASRPATLEALLVQPFVKDTTISVATQISRLSEALREDIRIERFARWDDQPIAPTVPPSNPANVVRIAGRK
jgi:elongation factor Ts